METVSGLSNWKLVIRREPSGITILQAVTCDPRAVLPEELFGLPVTALGPHALSPNAAPVQGEEVLVTCGAPAEEGWSNAGLLELTLPALLERIGDYALFNCAALKKLSLHDGVRFWGGGTLMNCRCLDTFHLTRVGEQGETLAYFADELSRELDVTIREADGGQVRLIFPEYVEVYEENCPAHHFDYNIYGAGYPYHHCFRNKKLSLKEYDALWKEFLGVEHDDGCAVRLAWWRLRYPAELTERAQEAYRTYLAAHVRDAAQWLLEQRDLTGLHALLEQARPDRETLSAACALAREMQAPEAVAMLLEEQHRRFPPAATRSFDL